MSTMRVCRDAETEALGEQDIWNTLAVLVYELGAVSQNLILTKTQDGAARNGLFANAIVELADLVTQCGIMLEKITGDNPDLKNRPTFYELVAMGIDRQLDRMEAYRRKESRRPTINEGQ